MRASNDTNNKALNHDDIEALRKATLGLRSHLDALIKSQPSALHKKTIKYFSNIVTKTQTIILYYDEYKLSNLFLISDAKLTARCLPIIHSIYADLKAVMTDEQSAPLPPILEENDYQLGLGLINALTIFIENKNPFGFILKLIKGILPNNTITNLGKACEKYRTILIDQIANSSYSEQIIRKTDEYLEQMSHIFMTYQGRAKQKPTDISTMKTLISANLHARNALEAIVTQCGFLPDELTYGPGGKPCKLRLHLIEQKDVYRQKYIDELKSALHEFKYLNLNAEQLSKLIQRGIDNFPTGRLSNKKFPDKNLNGILTLLKNDITPFAAHTSSHISGYPDKEHEQVDLGNHLQIRASLLSG